ncbi:MAG: sugar phosphate nucleotidyltransferase [Ignisphaera sp.]
MKNIILHGGAGIRLRPLTFSDPKQLIPITNKPVSQYVLEDLGTPRLRRLWNGSNIMIGRGVSNNIKFICQLKW